MEEHRFFTRKDIKEAITAVINTKSDKFYAELFEIGEYSHTPKTLEFCKTKDGIINIIGTNRHYPYEDKYGYFNRVSVSRALEDEFINTIYNDEFNIDSRRL